MVQEKKVIDEVSGWLTMYDDGSVDRTWTGPPEVKFMSDAVPTHTNFIDGVATADVTSGNLKLRLYLPETQENDPEKLPVLLHFHGGGFCISQADWFMYYAVYTRLARETRAIVVSVYLPLAPEHRLPAACETGFAALMLLRDTAASGGGGESLHDWLTDRADFGRVFLIGDSSGGNIVHYVAARAGELDMTPLRLGGAIPIHPGFCRSTRSKSEMEMPETPFLTLAMVDKFLSLSLPVGETKDHQLTCPMGEAAPPLEAAALPPYLYCVADQDLMKDTEMEFYEAMKRAKKDVELLINNGVGHSFYLNKIAVDLDPITAEQTRKLFKGIKEFIDRH